MLEEEEEVFVLVEATDEAILEEENREVDLDSDWPKGETDFWKVLRLALFVVEQPAFDEVGQELLVLIFPRFLRQWSNMSLLSCHNRPTRR